MDRPTLDLSVQPLQPTRFVAKARWRCERCNSHWTATRTASKATQAALEHGRVCRGE